MRIKLIHYLLTQIHELRIGNVDPIALLPHTIDHEKLQTFANQQVALAKEVLNSS